MPPSQDKSEASQMKAAREDGVAEGRLPLWAERWVIGALGGLLSLVLTFGGCWVNKVDNNTERLSDRVGSLERDMAEVKANVKNLQGSSARMEDKLDKLLEIALSKPKP